MTRRNPRRMGWTLIELLIVMAIIVVIATLGFLFLPNLNKNRGLPNATTQIEGWVNLSKQQALRDKKAHGIRFIQDPSDPTRVTALQYVEQADPVNFADATYVLRVESNSVANPAQPFTATLMYPVGVPRAWEGIEPGDVLQVTAPITGIAIVMGLDATKSKLILDRSIDGLDPSLTDVPHDGFKVIRSPRPLVGEPNLQLNKDVYIDLTWCYPCPLAMAPLGNTSTFAGLWSNWKSDDPPTILFNASGFVANASTGQIILAVRHVDRPNDMLFVTVYTRTGKIGAHSVNDVPGGNPYLFTRDGSTPGF